MGKVAINKEPHDEREQGGADDKGHEIGRHLVYNALDGGFTPLCLLHQLDNLGERALLAYFGRLDFEQTLLVEGRPDNGRPRCFFDGQALARQHAFVHGRLSLPHQPIHGDFFAGAHQHHIPAHHLGDGNVEFLAVAHDARRFRPQPNQLFDGRAGLPLRSHLEQFAQHNQGDNHGRCLEVDMVAEGVCAHQDREDDGHAVKVGYAGAEGDQHVHVGTAAPQRFVAADVIIPADIKLDGGGEGEKEPVDPLGAGPFAQQAKVSAHAENEEGQGEDGADEEAALLVVEFGRAGCCFRVF